MAKAKNKKKSVADNVRSKKKGSGEKVNPFEVKINKQKHKVVGQKIGKHDKGRPGVSRSRAMQKRKETLLVEYKKRGKVNKFVDKRIGENDPEMSMEDKMLQRFAAERQKNPGKSIYNLNEDEELTHYGQSLAEIEKFDQPLPSDDDDDDDGRGKIGAKMVSEEFFGGGVLSQKEDDSKHKTWKERMEEIIAKSKKHKYERQSEKEQLTQLTEQADQEWKLLSQAMATSFKKRGSDDSDVKQKNDYDIMVRELHFAIKGTPSDRMKTEEEVAKEEKEKLEKLEADRMRRMKGLSEAEDKERNRAYRSADSLDDDFYAEPKERFEVMYKDGKLVTGKDDESDQSESEEGSGDDESGSGDADDDDGAEGGEEEEGSGDDSDGEDSESDDVMKHMSDLESEGEETGEEEEEEEKGKGKGTKTKEIVEKEEGKEKTKKSVKFKEDAKTAKDRQKEIEEAKKELPYTFKAPANYEELLQLLSSYSEMEQVICLERLRKCHHPSLAEGNKDKLQLLFSLLVQYYGDLALHKPPLFWLMDKLVPHLFELSQLSTATGAQAVLELIMDRQAQYCEVCQRRNGKGVYPQLDVLMHFKLIAQLYPTSDMYHHVVTPTMLFMSQVLTQSCVNTNRDVACGLLLCNIFLEYVTFSKRFVPEVINFLNGVLFLCFEKDPRIMEPVIPPFRPVGKNRDLLLVKQSQHEATLSPKLSLIHIFTPAKALKYLATDQFRVDAIHLAVQLLQRFCDLYEKAPAHDQIFHTTQHFCDKLPLAKYPQALQDSVSSLKGSIAKHGGAVRKFLVWEKKKTKALKLYEPKFEEDFDPTRKKKIGTTSKAKDEKQRLIHKHKQEMKGAKREIRRDAQFLAKQRLDEQIGRDNERKRKVKELLADLATQQGDINALKRKKGRV